MWINLDLSGVLGISTNQNLKAGGSCNQFAKQIDCHNQSRRDWLYYVKPSWDFTQSIPMELVKLGEALNA